jgi:hypothetical protein
MSFTKSKNDACFSKQQQSSNKSIFDYVVDNSKFVNQNECNNYSPPFLTYIPTGVSVKNVDIENDLKGITRPYTRCAECQYSGLNASDDATIKQQPINVHPNNKKECTPKYNVLPNGYIQKI